MQITYMLLLIYSIAHYHSFDIWIIEKCNVIYIVYYVYIKMDNQIISIIFTKYGCCNEWIINAKRN